MSHKRNQFFAQVQMLYKNKVPQKEIAERLGLTEKTIGVWLKEIKQINTTNAQNINELEAKLTTLIQDKKSSTTDIKNLTIAIKNLEKRGHNN